MYTNWDSEHFFTNKTYLIYSVFTNTFSTPKSTLPVKISQLPFRLASSSDSSFVAVLFLFTLAFYWQMFSAVTENEALCEAFCFKAPSVINICGNWSSTCFCHSHLCSNLCGFSEADRYRWLCIQADGENGWMSADCVPFFLFSDGLNSLHLSTVSSAREYSALIK